MDIKVMSQGGQSNLGSSVNSSVKLNDITNEGAKEYAKTNKVGNKDVISQNSKDNTTNNKKELDNAVSKLNGFLEDEDAYAKLSFYHKTNRLVVTVYDNDDNIIMQIPSEKVLDMVDKMSKLLGVSVDKKA